MHLTKNYFASALVTAFTVNLLSFLSSASFSWTSPVIPKFRSNDSTVSPLPYPPTVFQESLLASIGIVGGFPGVFISRFVSTKFGPKITLLLSGLPMIVGHLMFAFAGDISVFITGRAIFGIGLGICYTMIPGYVAEIANESNRGFLGTFISIQGCLGQLFVYAVGPYVSVQVFSLLHLIPLTIFYVIFVFSPDSPYKILAKGDMKKAENIIQNLRGTNDRDIIEKEMAIIKDAVERQGKEKGSFMDLVTNKTLRKAVTITCLVVTFQQSSGLGPVLAYMQPIFDSVKINLSPSVTPVIVQSIFFASVLFFSQIIDKMGRKFWLVLSGVGVILSQGTLGVYFYLKSLNYDLNSVSWLPVLCVIFYFVSYSAGFLNIPWILMGEYFPQSHKSEASAITMLTCLISSAIVTLCFPLVGDAVGEYVIFGVFCGIVAIGVVFIMFRIPETKGETFSEIQHILREGKL